MSYRQCPASCVVSAWRYACGHACAASYQHLVGTSRAAVSIFLAKVAMSYPRGDMHVAMHVLCRINTMLIVAVRPWRIGRPGVSYQRGGMLIDTHEMCRISTSLIIAVRLCPISLAMHTNMRLDPTRSTGCEACPLSLQDARHVAALTSRLNRGMSLVCVQDVRRVPSSFAGREACPVQEVSAEA